MLAHEVLDRADVAFFVLRRARSVDRDDIAAGDRERGLTDVGEKFPPLHNHDDAPSVQVGVTPPKIVSEPI